LTDFPEQNDSKPNFDPDLCGGPKQKSPKDNEESEEEPALTGNNSSEIL
jgi:hypothetical protein